MISQNLASKLMLYKYTIDDIAVIFSNGKIDKIPNRKVGSINIEKDYDNDMMPILNINIVIDRNLYKQIVADKDMVKFKIVINRFMVKNNDQYVEDGPRYMDKIIDDTFLAVISDSDIDEYTTIQNKDYANSKNIDDKDTPEKENSELNLFLFKEEALNVNKKIDNYIFSNTEVATPLVMLADKCGVKKMLFTQPDNNTKYNQIIIPDTTLSSMIESIQQMYGIYNHGYILFYDFDMLYLISKNKNDNIFKRGELENIHLHIGEFSEASNNYPGSYLDKSNNRYFINVTDYPAITNAGTVLNEAAHTGVKSVNMYNNTNKQFDINLSDRHGYVAIKDNKYDNKFLINSELYKIEESYYSMSVTLPEIDFNIFTPNKKYSFEFDIKDRSRSKKYNGSYRLYKHVTVLSKDSSERFLMSNTVAYFKSGK